MTTKRITGLDGNNAPIPALAVTASCTAATLWYGANIYVSFEAWP